jgi:hypothetical protein
MFVAGEDGQVQSTEAAALTAQDLAAVQQQVRARVLRWFAPAGYVNIRTMPTRWPAGTRVEASRSMPTTGASRSILR